ncbi:hypothetical protein T05_3138, partial [Trichinella murrelli]
LLGPLMRYFCPGRDERSSSHIFANGSRSQRHRLLLNMYNIRLTSISSPMAHAVERWTHVKLSLLLLLSDAVFGFALMVQHSLKRI